MGSAVSHTVSSEDDRAVKIAEVEATETAAAAAAVAAAGTVYAAGDAAALTAVSLSML